MTENTAEMIADVTPAAELTMDYVLQKIDEIASQTDYLRDALARLGAMKFGQGPGDIAGQAQAQAVGDIVRCRETTNQQLLKLYEKMYEDLKPKPSERLTALQTITNLKNVTGDTDDLRHILNMF